MSADAEEVTRLRKPRFSYEENQILIQEVRSNYGRLYGTQSRRVTVGERRRVWENIAAKINGITSWRRTGQEVQKRWNDFKRRTKEKMSRVPHSTQGTGANNDEAYSAEEETIFAILGPGVVSGSGCMDLGIPRDSLHHSMNYSPRFHLQADHRSDLQVVEKGSSSPETSANASCCAMEGGLLQLKQRDSPPPLPEAEPEIQIIQLPELAHSPDDDPASGSNQGDSPTHNPRDSPPRHLHSISPPLQRRRPHLELPLMSDPSLEFLQAQRETTEAIRDLAYTIRQSIDKLTSVVATVLPLFQNAGGLVDPEFLPHSSRCSLPGGMLSTPSAPSTEEVIAIPTASSSSEAFTTKVEASPDRLDMEPQQDGDILTPYELQEDDQGIRPDEIIEIPITTPLKRRRGGYMSSRKRRGRWKRL
ncbi:myb-related transcription factor, partner of profilin [Ambystoma mexicanum]|uniref:myb-related transcription factor, partner of profilin n=1 Tax=Ambystoma mexicanum TaxID=8296 RepID=UPI0037E98BA0